VQDGELVPGCRWGQLVPELAGQGVLALLDRVYRAGEPHTGRDARLMLGTGPAAREAFFDFTCEPRVDSGGNVTGVRVSDIATDSFWRDFRDLARAAGMPACWSTPILARDGSLLGTFAMYHRVPRAPQESDLALARMFAGPRRWRLSATRPSRPAWPPRRRRRTRARTSPSCSRPVPR
jgi:GAF domain-containing protein